ncbi:uncharacterized protein LOC132939272 isoform X2 [Metopolophium dirhodum]|uniref:uncharacterized protein LOC132939272 isoform X2 n=1 Tax=Metopolophium dirhodum TaxID=44670 RepID=UPI00298F4E9A|nr:uncharacterized protein LOC132939272 isoform X2 [Metopolophium dirhodum]
MDKMDEKKSSQTKRNIVKPTDNKKKDVKKNQVKDKKQGKKDRPSDDEDNTNQGGDQSFCEDQKDSKKIICEKDLKSLNNDDEEGWCVQRNNKKKTSHQSLSEEQKCHKNVPEKSKLSDSKQNKTHDNNNIDSHEDKQKSVTKMRKRRKDKKKISQEQNDISDMDLTIDDKFNQTKVHDGNNINVHEENTLHLSNDDSAGWMDEKKNKKTSCQSLSKEQKSHKNVQKQNKWSEKDSIHDNMKQAHDRKKIDWPKNTRKSEEVERPRDKYKNNNGQKQSRFSDACVLEEIDEDIFKLSKEYSLAHCVAEDLRMGAGIAVDFKNIFGGVGKLVDQKLKIGDVGIVKRHDQYAFYLVTKKTSNGKPTMITMEKALHSLLNKMKENNLTKLGIPTIGCGLDRLDWSDTKSLINKIFSGSGIHITVCVPSKLLDSKKTPRLTVYITPKHLWEMETETIIILFIDIEKTCNKNWTDHIMDKVDAKYPFKENLLKDIRNKKPDPGDIKNYNVKNEVIICIFTTENTYYGSLENGFKTIDHNFKGYKYLAIQSDPIDYPSDNFQRISWIVLISRSVIHSSELWLCGDVKQNNYKVYYDEYCKNVLSMNNSFQYNSPIQKYNRYNDDRRSNFNTKETSNQR